MIKPETSPALSSLNRDAPLLTAEAPLSHDVACDNCGYNLRSLTRDDRCPECGHPVVRSLSSGVGRSVGRADRRWAFLVLLGLAMTLATFPSKLWVVLNMDFDSIPFGTAPKLNVPGPKIWAVPLVQRSVGYRPEMLGANGTWLSLLGVLAAFLITTPRRSLEDRPQHAVVLAWAARWVPPLLVGGYFGFLLNAEGTYSRGADVRKYAMLGVAGVELPCTLLLLAYLARVARELAGPGGLAGQFALAAAAAAILQMLAVAMDTMAPLAGIKTLQGNFVIQLWSAIYGAACVATALVMIAAMVRLILELAVLVMPRKMIAWFD